jgi:HD-GYP domain-containing protein (c-di-GMP phosphodiesterase class II)
MAGSTPSTHKPVTAYNIAMQKEKIPVRQLQPGLYIELPLKWNEHPFLFSRFKLKAHSEIRLIQQLGVEEVWYYPEKSLVEPAPESQPAIETVAADGDALREQWQEKNEHAEELRRRRLEIQRVEKQYNEVVGNVKELMSMMNASPVQAMEQATKMVGSIVATLKADKETLVHLMNANNLDDGLYYHVLNVSVLSLLLARELGLEDREQMMTLGLAALLHDIGQIKLPSQLLRKTTPLTKPESDLYQRHIRFGLEMIGQHAKLKLTVKPLLLTIIEQHHVLLDGSGYPDISAEKMHPLSKILATVNYYDKLCNHTDPKQSMTPHEALSLMFSKNLKKFDKKTLQILVKLLGIYPPGTVVQLSDESTGIVISLNRDELLKPRVLLYSAEIPKDEAVIIDLTQHPDLSIRKSLRPAQLSKEMFEYLNPRERVSYFFAINKPAGQESS